jgi:type IV secretion system protein VirB9
MERVSRGLSGGAAARCAALLACVAAIGIASEAHAQGSRAPRPRADERVRTAVFSNRAVYSIAVQEFRGALVELAPDEVIETMMSGDTASWQIEKNAAGNAFFVKPMEVGVQTSLTVKSERRTYVFELRSLKEGERSKDAVLRLTFEYPEEERARKEAAERAAAERQQALVASARALRPEAMNFAYDFSGDSQLVPELMFDDGKATYLRFRNPRDLPAIFVVETVDGEKRESLANYRVESDPGQDGEYVVVHRVAEQFSLRVDQRLACIKARRRPSPVVATVNGPRAVSAAPGRRWNPLAWWPFSAQARP